MADAIFESAEAREAFINQQIYGTAIPEGLNAIPQGMESSIGILGGQVVPLTSVPSYTLDNGWITPTSAFQTPEQTQGTPANSYQQQNPDVTPYNYNIQQIGLFGDISGWIHKNWDDFWSGFQDKSVGNNSNSWSFDLGDLLNPFGEIKGITSNIFPLILIMAMGNRKNSSMLPLLLLMSSTSNASNGANSNNTNPWYSA